MSPEYVTGWRGERAHSQRNWTGLSVNNNKKLFTEANGSKKGQAENLRSKLAGQECTGHQEDRTKDKNLAIDKKDWHNI